MPQYRELRADELTIELFEHFERRQVVTDRVRQVDGKWAVLEDPSVDDWGPDEYARLVECLKGTIQSGGVVWAAFIDDELKGFASVEGLPMGSAGQYMELTSLHVSSDARRNGIGAVLFLLAADFARNLGTEKLYISAHSAVETQAFYKAMGCVDAEEPSMHHLESEPGDRQLEYLL